MSRAGRALTLGLVLVAAVAGAVVLWQVFGGRVTSTADLFALVSAVERLDATSARQEDVAAGEHRDMRAGDGVTVDSSGRARLQAAGCVLEVFRDTGLAVEEVPGLSAPACVVQLTHGSLDAQVSVRTVVDAEWAVVTASGTGFFVHLDVERGLLWVIVRDGEVRVEAGGAVVVLTGGEQTWVARGSEPEGVRPATRAAVGDLFPAIEDLTNRALRDRDLLSGQAGVEVPRAPETETSTPESETPAPGTPTTAPETSAPPAGEESDGTETVSPGPEPQPESPAAPPESPAPEPEPPAPPPEPEPEVPGVVVTQDVARVWTGECPGPHTLTVTAELSGTAESLAQVGAVVARYGWDGTQQGAVQLAPTGRSTYAGVIDPAWYVGLGTTLEFVVEVLGLDGTVLTSATGGAGLIFCLS